MATCMGRADTSTERRRRAAGDPVVMHRHNLQFPTKETALREDVHALGSLVGEVLRDQGGEDLLKLVEGDRVAAIRRREGEQAGAVELVARATNRPAQQASDLVRAFSKWFEVVNLAERVHRVRRRREYMNSSDRPQPGGIGDCMYRLKAAGLDGGQVLALLRDVTIYPVFTAHPTESSRRTMLRKQQQIADLMIERLDPTLTPAERRSVWERIRMEVTSGWQTEVHPRERLTVADEREHVLFYLAEVVYRVVPALYEELSFWLETVFGVQPEARSLPLLLRFGTWVGGDMDGNAEVHAKTIRETLHRHQQRIISAYYEECRALSGQALAERQPRGRQPRAGTAHRRIRHPAAERAPGDPVAPRPHALSHVHVAGRGAAADDLRRPPESLRIRRALHPRHRDRRREPARKPRPARRAVPGRAPAVPRAHLRLPPRDARRAPACVRASRSRAPGARARGLEASQGGCAPRRAARGAGARPRAAAVPSTRSAGARSPCSRR